MYIVKVYNSFILLRKKLMPYISVFNVLIFFFFPAHTKIPLLGNMVVLFYYTWYKQAILHIHIYKKKKKETTTRALDRILQPAYN